MSVALADKLQIWGFLEDVVVFGDASLGFGLAVQALDVCCADEQRIDAIAQSLIAFLNGLPPNLDIQFLQEIGTGNDGVLNAFENLGQNGSNVEVAALHRARVARLRDEDARGLLPAYRLRVFVRRPAAGTPRKPSILSSPQTFEALSEQFLAREVQALNNMREEIARGLNAIGLTAKSIPQRDLADLAYWQWNPSRPIALSEYSDEDVRSSLLFSDVLPSTTGFEIGGVQHRIVSLKLLPDQTFSAMASVLNELPFDSRAFVSIHVPDQQKELEALQTQRRLAFSMARGKTSGVSDIESEAKFQDLESLINEMVAQGEKVFHMSLNVILKSTDEQELHDQVSQTLHVIREMSGAEAMEESLAAFDIFSELSIPNARSKERAKKIKSSNLADILPVYAPWRGHETPRMLLKSTSGNLVSFDPFSSSLSNYNQIVTGGSGSGKSFLTNLLLLQLMKENPKLFIVDIGGSYRKLCDSLSGQYIPFDLNSGLSINPFDLPLGETCPSSQKLKFLVGLVELMTREEGAVGIGKLERFEIEEAIQRLYETGETLTLSHLRDALLKHPDRLIQRIGKILGSWCGETPYGWIVDRPTSVRLDRSLVSFDLKGLESYPDLQAVALYLVTDFVWREIQSDRERMKVLVFDECWKLLESPVGASFIGEVFRTFRKYFASAIAISQNIDDFSKSRVASAVLPNTSIKWVLMQKGADHERLKEVLHLNDREVSLISQLSQERGVYSQAFLMAEDSHCIVSIEPTPLEYWMATTDPRDLALIQRRGAAGDFNTLKAISEEFPKGVAAKGSES
jgi:conjugal transfer ATP-binding protein TraC